MILSEEDECRVSAAIKAIEERTGGEIVGVLDGRSGDDNLAGPVAVSAMLVFVLSFFLVAFTKLSGFELLGTQIAVLLFLSFAIAKAKPLRCLLVPRGNRRAETRRAALEQFLSHGLARNPHRAGVLIFVSPEERYVDIIADEGITSKADQTVWRYPARDLLDHLKEGMIAEGFVRAVKTCGAVLVKHFPAEGKKDQTRPPRFFVLSGPLSGSRPRRNLVRGHAAQTDPVGGLGGYMSAGFSGYGHLLLGGGEGGGFEGGGGDGYDGGNGGGGGDGGGGGHGGY